MSENPDQVKTENISDDDHASVESESSENEDNMIEEVETEKKKRSRAAKFMLFLLWAALGVIALAAFLAIIPTRVLLLEPDPNPSENYAQSIGKIKNIQKAEEGIVCDECLSRFYLHDDKTDTVYVLIHGLTSSPRQWVEFAEKLHDEGNNVMIPLMPYHGRKDLDVANLKSVKPEDLREYADNSIDIAQGLGDDVVVIGLSGGGTVAGWIAQNRSDVDTVMMIAPFEGIGRLPFVVDSLIINLFSRIPNVDLVSDTEPQRAHVYKGQSTHGIATYLRFGKSVNEQADANPSSVKNIILVTNASDEVVNNKISRELIGIWEKGGAQIISYEYPEKLELPHNIIGITEVENAADTVYPELYDLLEKKSTENSE